MTLDEVKRVRDIAGDNHIIAIGCDDNVTFWGGPVDGYEGIWDDENELFYQLRPNMSSHTQVASPIELTVVPYSTIQYVSIKPNLKETIEFLKDKVGKNDDEINTVIKNLKVFGEKRNTAIMRPTQTYADGKNEAKTKE